MPVTKTAPVAVHGVKEFEIEGQSYKTVSAKTMRYVVAAFKRRGEDASGMEILKEATDLIKLKGKIKDEVLSELYVYGRYQFDLRPKELGEFLRPKMSDPVVLQKVMEDNRICSVRYWRKKNQKPIRY